MERVVWTGTILAGREAEYERRHREIWPEMVENLKAQGISNYSIFRCGQNVIGYYECEDLAQMHRIKAANPAAARWAESMEGIIEICKAGGAADGRYRQIFYLK